MKLVLLGNPDLDYSWKKYIEEDSQLLSWDTVHLHPLRTSVNEIISRTRGADLFLWAYTHDQLPEGDMDKMWTGVRKNGCITASLHLDLYRGIPHREHRIGRTSFWKAEYVFTPDGGDNQLFKSRGVNHFWLQPAMPTKGVFKAEPSGEFPHDVVFVGSCSPIAHKHNRRPLLRWALRRYRTQFGWYGESIESRHPGVRGDRLNTLFSSVKVVLGDSANPSGEVVPNYWSDRVPITLGRGGVLVHPELPGMREQGFIDGITFRTFKSKDFRGLEKIIDELLEDDSQRETLVENALQLIKSQHTWAHRLQEIESVISK